MRLFHGTTKKAFDQIIVDQAILPDASEGGIVLVKSNIQKPKRGYVYLTDDYDTAEWYARGINNHTGRNDGVVILEVEIDESLILPDSVEYSGDDGVDSLKETSQCRVKGKIPYSNVVEAIILYE